MSGSLKRPALVVATTAGALALFVLAVTLLKNLVEWARSAPNGFALEWIASDLSLKALIVMPVGIIGVNAVVLSVEFLSVGWEKSALRRVLFLETKTSRLDYFYFLLRVSGVMQLIAFAMTFGLVYIAAHKLGQLCKLDLLSGQSFPLQLAAVVLVNTFVFYWAHRLMHARFLFEIHKVHHSALELNVLTPLRNHPIDFIIMVVINSVPAAILGADPLAITLYMGINSLYQCAVHSEMRILENAFFKALVVTPLAHKIHHSNNTDHFGKNYGILTLWEKLFGTYYYPPRDIQLVIGIDDDAEFNTDKPIRETVLLMGRWLGLRK